MSTKNSTQPTYQTVYETLNEILEDAHNMLEISLDHQNELVDATFEEVDRYQELQSEIEYYKKVIQNTEKAMEQLK